MQPHSKAQSLAPRSMVLSLFLVIPWLRATASALDGFARLSPAQDLRVQPGARSRAPRAPTTPLYALIALTLDPVRTPLCPHAHVVVVQSLSRVRLFVTPWTAARQASPSITIFQILLRLMSIESVMPSKHLIICRPLSSCPQSFPASVSFLMSRVFALGGQSIGAPASASVLPMNIQG